MRTVIAAAFIDRVEVVLSREHEEDTLLMVAGFVAWNPEQQEWKVTGVRVTETNTWQPDNERGPGYGEWELDSMSGDLRGAKEEDRAKDALISEAERERVGDCVSCYWTPRAKADGADWLCKQCREQIQKRRAA